MAQSYYKLSKKRLGEILMAEGLVTPEQVTEGLEEQKRTGKPLAEVLIALGHLTERGLAEMLATQFQLPFLSPMFYDVDRQTLALISPKFMHSHQFIPMDRFGNILIVAMAGLLSNKVIDQITQETGCEVRPYITTISVIRESLNKYVPLDKEERELVKQEIGKNAITELEETGILSREKESKQEKVVRAAAESPPAHETIPTVADEEGAKEIVLEGISGDVNWQALFDEIDRTIRKEVTKKRQK